MALVDANISQATFIPAIWNMVLCMVKEIALNIGSKG